MYSSGRSVNDWLPLFFMLLFHSLHLHQLFYNRPCITSRQLRRLTYAKSQLFYNRSCITRKFKNRFFSARNTRTLEMFCNALYFNPLPLLIEIPVLFDVNVCCNLRQVIVYFDGDYKVKWLNWGCEMRHIAVCSASSYDAIELELRTMVFEVVKLHGRL